MDSDVFSFESTGKEPDQVNLTDIETEIISSDDMQQMRVDLSRSILEIPQDCDSLSDIVGLYAPDMPTSAESVQTASENQVETFASAPPQRSEPEPVVVPPPVANAPEEMFSSSEVENPLPASLVPTVCLEDLSRFVQMQQFRTSSHHSGVPFNSFSEFSQTHADITGSGDIAVCAGNNKLASVIIVRSTLLNFTNGSMKYHNGTYPRANKLPIPKDAKNFDAVLPEPPIPVVLPRPSKVSNPDVRRPCRCSKSHCLKLYCDCFNLGLECQEDCECRDCFNNETHESERSIVIATILSRNPTAFQPKVQSHAEVGSNEKAHVKGCRCRKSGCLKKYCECYMAKTSCGSLCRCTECRNLAGNTIHYGTVSYKNYARPKRKRIRKSRIAKNLDIDEGPAENDKPQLETGNLAESVSDAGNEYISDGFCRGTSKVCPAE